MVATVVHDCVERDDEVPHPGGCNVTASEEGPDTDGKCGHQHPVHWVAVTCRGCYRSSELVVILQEIFHQVRSGEVFIPTL